MDDLSLIQKHLDESIEDAISTNLSFSALHLASTHEENVETELGVMQSLIENEVSYKLLKQKLTASAFPPSKFVKPKMNSTSSSLFDMFSSCSQFSPRLNIRDILDASESELLDKCYEANVDDLILGFNTTNDEVVLLGSMIFDQLALEISTCEKSNDSTSKSFLDIHAKWMEVCVKEEECHSFAFVLLRNVILGVQYTKLSNNTIRLVHTMMKMLVQYMKTSNDGTTFQASCTQIFYLLVEVFFRHHKSRGAAHAVMAYYDQDGELFSQCIASMSSQLLVQNCVLRANFIEYLLSAILHLSSPQNETLLFLKSMDKKIDHENMLVVHLLSLLKVAIMNISSLTFHCRIVEENEIVNFLTIGDLPTFFSLLETRTTSNCETSESNKTILCLLQPFYQVLEIGITSETSHFFNATLGNICEDAIVHIILCGCSRDHIMLDRIMTCLSKLLETVISTLQINSSEKNMFEEDESSGLLVLSPALRSLFQIYKRILTDIPWSDLHDCSFIQRHYTSIFACLRDLLLASKNLGTIDNISWNSSISILLPIAHISYLRDSILNDEESLKSLIALLADHEHEAIKMNSIEVLMSLHCILFSFKGYKVIGKDEKLLAKSMSNRCWGMFLTGCKKRTKVGCDNMLSKSQTHNLSGHLTKTEEVSSATKCLSGVLIAMTLMKQIKEMLN